MPPRHPQKILGAYERLTLAYLLSASALIFLLRRDAHAAVFYAALNLGVALGIAAICACAARWQGKITRAARHWYPLAVFAYCFKQLDTFSLLFVGEWRDNWAVAFDHAVFGVHPTEWLARHSAMWLTEVMMAFYATYYFYTVALLAALYAARESGRYWQVVTSTAAAYVSGYVIAMLVPMEGPRHALAALHPAPLEGGVLTALIAEIQRFGGVHGAAFPSLHVAGAMVAVLCARSCRRAMFWIFLPLFAGMCVSAVYTRYHYAVDVLGGLLIGWLGWKAGTRLEAGRAD
jgi:membrane-associated phospholipid phosphatase